MAGTSTCHPVRSFPLNKDMEAESSRVLQDVYNTITNKSQLFFIFDHYFLKKYLSEDKGKELEKLKIRTFSTFLLPENESKPHGLPPAHILMIHESDCSENYTQPS
jgi:hypothetical protein